MTPDTNKRECCERCGTGHKSPLLPYCFDINCPCHTEPSVGSTQERIVNMNPAVKRPWEDTNKRMGGWESWHFWRECHNCGYAGTGFLHCLHDGTQNNCPRCDDKMPSIPEDCDCEFVSTNEEIKEKIDLAHSEGFKEGVSAAIKCVPESPKEPQKTRVRNKSGNLEMKYTWRKCRQQMLEALRELGDKGV